MRLEKIDVARDNFGNALAGATIDVYLAGTSTAANVYVTPAATTAVNSITSDADGSFVFYVDALEYGSYQNYKYIISAPAVTTDTFTVDNITIHNVVYGTYSVTANTTVSAGLHVPYGVIYDVAAGVTLTLNGPFSAGPYQIFSGSGTVAFGATSIRLAYAAWWQGSSVALPGSMTGLMIGTDGKLGVETDTPATELDVIGTVQATDMATDTINEKTATSGVTIDSVLLKDGGVTASSVLTDTITEKTLNAGVTIETVLIKDGVIPAANVSPASDLPLTWTAVPYNSGDFTAQGAMTWTVEAGDVIGYDYILIGDIMIISFFIDSSSIGGTPANALFIKVPAGKTIASAGTITPIYTYDNGTPYIGFIQAPVSSTTFYVYRDVAGGAWTASTNNTSVAGQIFVRVS